MICRLTHQAKQEPHDVGLARLDGEEQGGHSIVAGDQGPRPRGVQGLANAQKPAVGGVVQRAVSRAELRDVDGVGQARVIFQEVLGQGWIRGGGGERGGVLSIRAYGERVSLHMLVGSTHTEGGGRGYLVTAGMVQNCTHGAEVP